MLSPSLHLLWPKGHTRCARTSSKDHQGHVITHVFTTVLHSLLSLRIILPCSTDIPLSFSTLFTPSIHPVSGQSFWKWVSWIIRRKWCNTKRELQTSGMWWKRVRKAMWKRNGSCLGVPWWSVQRCVAWEEWEVAGERERGIWEAPPLYSQLWKDRIQKGRGD